MTQARHKHHEAVIIPASDLKDAIFSTSKEILQAVAAHHGLNEDLALSMLKRMDVPPEVLKTLSTNGRVLKYRKVRMALVVHPKVPRYVGTPLMRNLYTFELMQIALMPPVPVDIKRAAEDILALRSPTLSSGERLTLAKQGSGRIAAMLLHDKEARIISAALNNPRMTEILLAQAILAESAEQPLTLEVCNHPKWLLRRDVRSALLRSAHTPLAHAITCAQSFRLNELKELFMQSLLPQKIQTYLLETAVSREKKPRSW